MVDINFVSTLPQPPGLAGGILIANQIASNPTPTLADPIGSLLPMTLSQSLTGPFLSFPIQMFGEDLQKALAIHEYPNRDGARVENMGNKPRTWELSAIFTNNIGPGGLETWTRGRLFPGDLSQGFIAIRNLLDQPGSLWMQHPIDGQVAVQVVGRPYMINATGPRDGVKMQIKLIETYPDNGKPTPPPLSSITAATRISTALRGLNNFLNALGTINDALAYANLFSGPPGLSLNNFFGSMAISIQGTSGNPGNSFPALGDPTLVVSAYNSPAIATTTPPLTAQLQHQTIQSLKPAPLGTPLNPFPNNNNNITQSTVSSMIQKMNLGSEALKATQSLLALNTQPSKNVQVFLNKCQRATYDTLQYYIKMNRNEVSLIIDGLQQMLASIQNAMDAISSGNTNLTNVSIQTYITPNNPISWYQLSKALNNSLDDLFSLNTIPNSNYLYVPPGTQIKFYQA